MYRALRAGFGVFGLILLTGLLSAQGFKPNPKKSPDASKADPGKSAEPPKSTQKEPKWPKEIDGKDVDAWLKELAASKDASARESMIRTVVLFGPPGRKVVCPALVNVLKNDHDYACKMAALSAIPALGFDDITQLNEAVRAIKPLLWNAQYNLRYEATLALGRMGPLAKSCLPELAGIGGSTVPTGIRDTTTWQIRRAAAFAIARVAYVSPEDSKSSPDPRAFSALFGGMLDSSVQVRRESIQSILILGAPGNQTDYNKLRNELMGLGGALRPHGIKDKDPSVAIWSRVALMRMEVGTLKENDPHLTALAKMVTDAKEPASVRLEALQAIGVMGKEAKWKVKDILGVLNNDKEPVVLVMAISTLAQIGAETKEAQDPALTAAMKQALPTLEDMKKNHKEEAIKKAAAEAVDIITGKKKLNQNPPMKEPDKKDQGKGKGKE